MYILVQVSIIPFDISSSQVRDDELNELDQLTHENAEYPVAGGSENIYGKVNILLQTHISRGSVESFSLISDRNYVVQVCQSVVFNLRSLQ